MPVKIDITLKDTDLRLISEKFLFIIVKYIKSIKIEYFEIRNKKNLSKNYNQKNFKIFIAYYNKKVRLIDNY